jgi:hypothetical protein
MGYEFGYRQISTAFNYTINWPVVIQNCSEVHSRFKGIVMTAPMGVAPFWGPLQQSRQ